MAIAIIYTPRLMTPQQYDETIRQLEAAGLNAPAGRLYHIAFGTESSLRVMDVFESQEAFDTFSQSLVPILQGLGVEFAHLDANGVHNIVTGGSGWRDQKVTAGQLASR